MRRRIAAIAEKDQERSPRASGMCDGNYYAPALPEKAFRRVTADEYRVRNWLWDRTLSGDILVEQNIHIVDLCNWMLGARPLKATATGGRNVLKHCGDCWDNYQVDFTYPGDVHFSFTSTQFGVDGVFDAGLRLFGSEGAATIPYAGPVEIVGTQKWAWQQSTEASARQGKFAANGNFEDNLAFADRDKERTFIDSIVNGPVHNQIAAGVETALSCMMGRMAGLRRRRSPGKSLESHGETYKLGMDLEQFA